MLRKTLDNLPLSRPYLIVTAIAVLIFYPTWARLAEAWLEFEQVLAHGLATAIIFLGLLLIHPPGQIDRQAPLKPYHLAGAVLLIVTTLVWGLLELVRIDTLAYLLLPAGLFATAWALLGFPRTLKFLPYILLLSLSLPIWADVVPALVDLASIVVGTWVGWFGMTALIEGNSITLPYGRLLIADGCSGIRYFAIAILLAMMTSILNDYRWRGWLITLLSAALIGLVANWVRITILVVVAYETDMQSEIIADHETMGWMVFGAFILPALYFSPVRRRAAKQSVLVSGDTVYRKGIIAIVAAVVLGPIALVIAQNTASQKPAWTINLPDFEQVQPEKMPLPMALPRDLDEQVWYSANTWISFAQSHKKSADEKLVPYLPQLFDNSIWHIEEQPEPGLRVYRNILTRNKVLVAQWYKVGSRTSWSYRNAKLLQIPAALAGETRFALITIQAFCGPRDCAEVLPRMRTTVTSVENQF
ncbi:exosortase/archaeosortase family protein [Marinobacter sp. 1_MG-2023]|uniref:exosortase/archaeosortase family protein n=1 Tax=Marinobacter sp. 1_MG-2023 TaxID=3062627 RepID=UPI0026E34EC8|nr:exosortase/archaeosortase family protein [Marinobacter sp. 1_MG-2023]MDO6824565.1 exosortase/archaeosortase family protein [Marinobacter sp. 1_MG-2023]